MSLTCLYPFASLRSLSSSCPRTVDDIPTKHVDDPDAFTLIRNSLVDALYDLISSLAFAFRRTTFLSSTNDADPPYLFPFLLSIPSSSNNILPSHNISSSSSNNTSSSSNNTSSSSNNTSSLNNILPFQQQLPLTTTRTRSASI
jgi:hypothetical protein